MKKEGLHFHSWRAHLGDQSEMLQNGLYPLIACEERGEQSQMLDKKSDLTRSSGTNNSFATNRIIHHLVSRDQYKGDKRNKGLPREPVPNIIFHNCFSQLENPATLIEKLKRKKFYDDLIMETPHSIKFLTGDLSKKTQLSDLVICVCK